MKRKTSTTQVRVYKYGLRPPTLNAKLVEDQFWGSGRYYNQLIENYRTGRDKYRSLLGKFPALEAVSSELETLEAAFLELETAAKLAKTGDGKMSDEQKAALKAARKQIKDARTARKALVDAESQQMLKDNPDLSALIERANALKSNTSRTRDEQVELEKVLKAAKAAKLKLTDTFDGQVTKVNFETNERLKKLRSASALRHGTYLAAEDAANKANETSKGPPRFKANDGSGKIGTQILPGITVQEAMSCKDTRLQIKPLADGWAHLPRHQRRKGHRTTVRIRVGTVTDSNKPVWAEFPVYLHRPLPSDAIIKWSYIVRKRVGRKFEWSLQLTVESNFAQDVKGAGTGAIALDLGWREGIRTAYAVDDKGEHAEITVPERSVEGYRKPEDIRSIRDKHVDSLRDDMVAWFRKDSVPEALVKRTTTLHKWKAPGRFHQLANVWAKEASDWEPDNLKELQAWAKQDRHLLDWESAQRAKVLAHRTERYRVVATHIAKTYSKVIIEDRADLKLTNMKLKPKSENGDPGTGRGSRLNMVKAAPGEFREILVKACKKWGASLVEVDPAYTSRRCHECKCNEKWENKSELKHTCEQCGVTFDRDHNAGKNILFDAGLGQIPDGGVLALPVYEGKSRLSNPRVLRNVLRRAA